ncbi:probable LRR receptor-like serine/threonine-protein kinase At3g47570 isoform X2 [Olea europaea var. sylvestris]|uniref:non-specific serine/threonine protein kinase n=1 Tax=Olea europaea subsp. europaea TaxID=158383 RepID=A0A8S0QFE1_OLEEU|nr:probable LRR receptor-like serine/threonine-protein kinase At3g47570 isoform X1 [Olea europaea var. sylvestris]XP_022882535.1 probable LRR receptor-like serine/threonine-protein kinase At3g47570 isoform X2 [Olea europaea var. sylvestris]CAA2965520.1 probable LRR receptor-like serine threonine-kinase At3g47570 [Olea europaea subsp. europaea]
MQMANYFLGAILFLHCLIAACLAMATTNITTDQSSLLSFKTHIKLDSSHILSKNWSVSTSVCVWIGVTCGLRHQRVTALDISRMNLTGKIPSQLGNLSFLISINITGNYFLGSVPKELIQLRRLKFMDLSVNKFSGEIPSWLHFLTKLQVLYLYTNSFTGFIPPSLFNISTLQFLDFSFNPLQGKIPEEIGNLHNLKILALQDNRLTGVIPLQIFNISTMKIFAFTGNNLTGNLPLNICHGFPRLQGLYLSKNELGGEIPSNLSECLQLQDLSLSNNRFSGSIPGEIGRIRTLQNLLLGSNDLYGAIPRELGNLDNLKELDMGSNFLNGSIPASIFNISSLQHIDFERCNLSGNLDPNSIANSSKLTTIMLSFNDFNGPIPNFQGKLRFLEKLHLAYNNFISESPELSFITSLTSCRYLTSLAFGNNPLNGILPLSIGNLSTSLQYLYGHSCDLRGSIPNEIGNLTSLIKLSLSDNELIESIPASMLNLQKLQGLYLQRNKISQSIPDSLCQLHNLYVLLLSQNLITGAIPRCIGNITTLRYLYIDTNRLTSSIPASLWLQKDLLGLNLSANTLSGSLPQEIGKLKATYLIDLSVNRFSGSIPSAIGDLLTLSNLFLAHNALQGSIPESMGKMLNLEQLDLSHNNLSGNIPKSLEALKYLSYLNISFNDLSGEVPSAGPFKNFSSESFMSNEGLCGDPLYGLPSCPTGRQKRSKQMLIVVFSLLGITFLILIVTALATYAIGKCRRKYLVENGVDFAPVTTLRVSYYELLRATEGYSESHLLGTGSLGSVYRGTLNNGRDVAVKVFNLQQQNAFKSFEVECEVLRNLRHRNLCKVISTCSNPDFKALVLEYMSNGSLEKWLYSNDNVLDILQRINIMIDVAYALEYLHYGYSTPIVHCDLKPSNVLLDENMVAYLSDFGIAKLLGEGESNANTTTLGTLGYIAPEYGLEGSVSIKCDVYSYGIMLMEVFTRMKPNDEKYSGDLTLRSWVNDSMPNAITQIVDSNLLGPEELSTKKLKCLLSIMELALNCSIESAGERVNMKEVVVALKNIRFQLLT